MALVGRNEAWSALGRLTEQIPADVRERLLPVARSVAKRDTPSQDALSGWDAAGEAAYLAARLGGLDDDEVSDLIVALLAGTAHDRQWAVRLARHVNEPEQVGLLVSAMSDQDPSVRAAAAHELADLVATGRGGSLAAGALRAAVKDPGAQVPAWIASGLQGSAQPLAVELLAVLSDHPSAFVRRNARSST